MASLNAIYRMAATNPVAPLLAFGVVIVVGLVSNYGGEDALEKSTSRDELNDLAPFNKSDHGLVLFDLPNIDREPCKVDVNGIGSIITVLHEYEVSPLRGFLPHRDPLQSLSGKYEKWEDLVKNVSDLILAKQIRQLIDKLPVISIDELESQSELRRAHLILCCLAHAYVWGMPSAALIIPKGVAIPLCAVSDKLHMPPILTHTDIVLYNWRRFDTKGEISLKNLATTAQIVGGPDEAWFYEITVEIEAVGAPAILSVMLCQDVIKRMSAKATQGKNGAMKDEKLTADMVPLIEGCKQSQYNGDLNTRDVVLYVIGQLEIVNSAIRAMVTSIERMSEGCMPFIFYHRIRPFLSGWKNNPTLPNGMIYEGVKNNAAQSYYGGSAAQSPLLPFLDISLGISHERSRSQGFLLAMRDYMIKPHRDFLEYQSKVANIREFVTSTLGANGYNLEGDKGQRGLEGRGGGSGDMTILSTLRDNYNACIDSLKRFRDAHMNIVHVYIIAQQKMITDSNPADDDKSRGGGDLWRTGAEPDSPRTGSQFVQEATGDRSIGKSGSNKSLAGAAGGKGTGGTDLMKFLRPIRDSVKAAQVS